MHRALSHAFDPREGRCWHTGERSRQGFCAFRVLCGGECAVLMRNVRSKWEAEGSASWFDSSTFSTSRGSAPATTTKSPDVCLVLVRRGEQTRAEGSAGPRKSNRIAREQALSGGRIAVTVQPG